MFSCRSWNGFSLRNWNRRWPNRMREFAGNDTAQWRSTGNHAFDEYREETLRRLEDEQSEFSHFLARLRMAKDRAEFDEFMDSRNGRTSVPSTVTDTQNSIYDPQS